jgi:hypothetical protein
VINELLYDFEVNVGFEQRQPNLAQSLLNIFFVEDGLASQSLERALQLFLKVLEHG